jgi:GNAT superfamily N-acetyltransferase
MPMTSPALMRRATPEDSAAVRALVRAAYAKWVPVIGREPLPMTVDYAVAVRTHTIDLLYLGQDLAGLVETIAAQDHLFVENLAVAPPQQGRGLGRALLRHAEATARQHGLAQLRLLTNQAFAANVQLYEAVGFQIDRTEPFMGGTTVYMSKTL